MYSTKSATPKRSNVYRGTKPRTHTFFVDKEILEELKSPLKRKEKENDSILSNTLKKLTLNDEHIAKTKKFSNDKKNLMEKMKDTVERMQFEKMKLCEEIEKYKNRLEELEKVQRQREEEMTNRIKEETSAKERVMKQYEELESKHLQLMNEYKCRTNQFVEEEKMYQSEISRLKEQADQKVKLRIQYENMKKANEDQINALKGQIQQITQKFNSEVQKFLEEKTNLSNELKNYQNWNQELSKNVENLKMEKVNLENHNHALQEKYNQLYKQASEEVQKLNYENGNLKNTIQSINCNLEQSKMEIQQKDSIILEQSQKIKKLQNTILDLKGKVRVFCRIRPKLEKEKSERTNHIEIANENEVHLVVPQNSNLGKREKKLEFKFDKVFPPHSNQATVYGEVADLIDAVLDGYKVCIFAYGQTGSGKTHTMGFEQVSENDESRKGLTQRTAEHLFAKFASSKDINYSLSVSIYEIYNDKLRDLLDQSKPNKNITKKEIKNVDELYHTLRLVSKNRATGVTLLNQHSSRSHCIVTFYIKGKTKESEILGVLNLIDLAGSERLSKSKASGETRKESIYINSSLSALADVINAIANNSKHIPFRNSLLTQVLQPNLEGKSKMVMFVNVAPTEVNLHETMSSLRFASRVNQLELGAAVKFVKS